MDSRSNQRWYGSDAVRVHHPGVQAHAYGCASFASGLLAKESVTDVLRRVVVCMVRIATPQTRKRLLRRTVILVSEPTRRTPTRGIRRVHLLNRNPAFFGFVRRVVVEAAERPRVKSLRAGHSVTTSKAICEHPFSSASSTILLEFETNETSDEFSLVETLGR